MSLSRSQVTELAEQLDRRSESLLEEVRDEVEHSENQQYIELIGRVPPDVGDQSVADALADLNLTIIDRHVQELRDIDAAKLRVGEGSFGVCIDCGGDIGFERLRAYPTAKRCRPCQEHREKTYAHQGTPSL
jgi:DnaK suppressor protein